MIHNYCVKIINYLFRNRLRYTVKLTSLLLPDRRHVYEVLVDVALADVGQRGRRCALRRRHAVGRDQLHVLVFFGQVVTLLQKCNNNNKLHSTREQKALTLVIKISHEKRISVSHAL